MGGGTGMGDGKSVYGNMGIDAQKGLVEKAFGKIIDNDTPNAFVNSKADKLVPSHKKTMKVDGDGSKPTQHTLHYLETGDETAFEPSADDSFTMVAGDAGAAGFVSEFMFEDIIDINKLTIPGRDDFKELVVDAYSRRIEEVIGLYLQYGFDVEFLGGETADLPSQVSGYTCSGALWARTPKGHFISGNISPGDSIWGFPSGGKAIWEKKLNSGLMCNGVTLACSSLMWQGYNEKYPFIRHEKNRYQGRFRIDDKPDGLGGMTVSEALRSPTRHMAIIFKLLINELLSINSLHLLHGITFNTGGGATKVLRLGRGIRYEKKMPELPPLFQLIKEENPKISWREMFEDFNCGVAADIIGSDEGGILDRAITKVSQESGVDCFRLGNCKKAFSDKNIVILETEQGPYSYEKE